MPSVVPRLLCLAVAFVLSGSPAVLAACTALCLDGPVVSSVATTHAGHGSHVPDVVSDPESHVHHHGDPVELGAHALATPPSQAGEASSHPRLKVVSDCCPEGPLSSVDGLRAERRDANLVGVAPVALTTTINPSEAAHQAAPPEPPTPPDSPARSSLVLRI